MTEADGSLTFQSYNGSPIISSFERVTEEFGTTLAHIKCAEHGDTAGAAGGAALVVDSCPSADLDVTFRLVGRTLLDGELPSPPERTPAPIVGLPSTATPAPNPTPPPPTPRSERVSAFPHAAGEESGVRRLALREQAVQLEVDSNLEPDFVGNIGRL